jgi:hypothetical protein
MVKTPIWDKSMKDIVNNKKNISTGKDIMLKIAREGNEKGIDSVLIAKAVYKQLQKKHTDARVLVGFDAHALSFIRKVLPTSIGDKIISIYL